MFALLLIPAALATPCPTITGTYDGRARVPVEGGTAIVDVTVTISTQDACSVSGQAVFSGEPVIDHLGDNVVFDLAGTVGETGALSTVMSGSFPDGSAYSSHGEGSARPLDGEGESAPPPAAEGEVSIEVLQRDVLSFVQGELELSNARQEDPDDGNTWW